MRFNADLFRFLEGISFSFTSGLWVPVEKVKTES